MISYFNSFKKHFQIDFSSLLGKKKKKKKKKFLRTLVSSNFNDLKSKTLMCHSV